MSKAFLIFLFFSVCFNFFPQQNLVPDGGFELYKGCPYVGGIGLYSINWFQPTNGSSDLFNACNTFSNDASVPLNAFGSQPPNSGQGYAGAGFRLIFNSDYKEYFSVGLKKKLELGRKYKIELYTSLSDSSWIALNQISILFSTDSLQSLKSISNTIPIAPQINFNCYQCYYINSFNWTKLESIYVADGTESFLTIGNFIPYNLQQFLQLKPITNSFDSLRAFNYYYFDDVSIIDVTYEKSTIPNVFTPNGDDINDVFSFNIDDEIKLVDIFNRWGVKVFETGQSKNYWDGRTTSGIECNDGIYYYIIEGNEKTYKGFIQLIR